ncbi:hypothetical protein D7322_07230 [Sphingobacterium puteale]|uniref:Uncharacterized protein n=2 Tax=Sphingobacterium TaxID=28453 RepID=A0A363NP61_9SPHI|nr:hypothetical protein DCO56_20110 [Sphingobacterium athyrii]RKO72578.1 hypothetical protein D7322_07230 [Sphingobacterium puteale]
MSAHEDLVDLNIAFDALPFLTMHQYLKKLVFYLKYKAYLINLLRLVRYIQITFNKERYLILKDHVFRYKPYQKTKKRG